MDLNDIDMTVDQSITIQIFPTTFSWHYDSLKTEPFLESLCWCSIEQFHPHLKVGNGTAFSSELSLYSVAALQLNNQKSKKCDPTFHTD